MHGTVSVVQIWNAINSGIRRQFLVQVGEPDYYVMHDQGFVCSPVLTVIFGATMIRNTTTERWAAINRHFIAGWGGDPNPGLHYMTRRRGHDFANLQEAITIASVEIGAREQLRRDWFAMSSNIRYILGLRTVPDLQFVMPWRPVESTFFNS